MNVTNESIQAHLATITEPRLTDILTLITIYEKITKKQPKMWGSIIGFGSLHYVYKTGHSGDMPMLGLASRKQAITLYLSNDMSKFKLLEKLGKYSVGKGCLYIKRLSDVNMDILQQLIGESFNDVLTYDYVTIND
ncbi:MAG: DUF1801 domain-containing protein [Acholeplasma sp.]